MPWGQKLKESDLSDETAQGHSGSAAYREADNFLKREALLPLRHCAFKPLRHYSPVKLSTCSLWQVFCK